MAFCLVKLRNYYFTTVLKNATFLSIEEKTILTCLKSNTEEHATV
jgi:hypothetical protein